MEPLDPLNLKSFNKNVEYHHFKMDTLHSILGHIYSTCTNKKPGCAIHELSSLMYFVKLKIRHILMRGCAGEMQFQSEK